MADQDFDIKIRTTADTTGAKQTEAELARLQQQAQKTATEAGTNIGRLLAPFISGFSAFKFVDQLNVVAERLKQTSEELAKQGAQITENALKYQELAKGARDEGDVIKIAEAALRDVESAQKRVSAAQQEELTLWDKITDSVYHTLINVQAYGTATADEGRIAKKVLDIKMEGQRQLAAMAQQDLVGAIRSSELHKAAFEKLKAEPLSQALDETNAKLQEQQRIIDGIDYTKFPKSWLEASKNIERTKSDLAEIVNEQKKGQPQSEELNKFLTKPQRPAGGRIAEAGESQDVVDQIERNRINAERVQQGLPQLGAPGAPSAGGPGAGLTREVVEAINRLYDLWR